MLKSAIIALIVFFTACQADAGPWLREKGTTFTSISVATTYLLETANQTYFEYGLSEKTTLVGDLSMAHLHTAPPGGYLTLSVRRALSKPESKSKWAYELGAGLGWIGTQTLPHLRTGLSWGRGITFAEKSGWATVEASTVWDLTYAQHITKIDSTIGVNFTDVTSGMLQLYTAHMTGETVATVAPSLVFRPKGSKFRIQIGTESQIGKFTNSALKLGLWREF